MRSEAVTIAVGDGASVTGLLLVPKAPRACYVMAHGAGAGMTHAFMEAVATGLGQRNSATLRYQFPNMEKGSKRPDEPKVAQGAVRAAVEAAAGLLPGIPLFAGGKSFGGRMTSQAQSQTPLPDTRGLVFFGFPLHPSGKPSIQRAEHLSKIEIPMLFLQGTRDALAEIGLLVPVIEGLGKLATLSRIENADHSFHVPVRLGKTDAEVMSEMLDVTADWISALL
jgi:predicted alpha/beta-hydrolase family hydrolase